MVGWVTFQILRYDCGTVTAKLIYIIQSSSRVILLVCSKVVSFTRGSEALLVDSAGHHDLPLVNDGAEHGPGSLHCCQLPPLRLLVVVHKHLVEGFAAEM